MKKNDTASDYLERILKAPVYDLAVETPLEPARILSNRIGNSVMLKREDMQPVFSFKLRGAYNKIAGLTPEQRKRGVICASAGNHAQGVALAAGHLGCKATVVMPVSSPEIKIDAVRQLGAHVLLHGESFDEACKYAQALDATQGMTFVHPFDDPDVIAGQGTIGMEIMRRYPARQGPLDAVFCAVGGGGLAAGVAVYIKHLWPEIKVIGVEASTSDAMKRSLAQGRRVSLPQVGLFSDGTAVRQVGKETFRLCREYLDDVVTVNTDAICMAIKDVFEDTRTILEPAGALAVAGAKEYAALNGCKGRNFVAITSGANMNFDRLRFVAERSDFGEHHEAVFAVTLPERPGSYREFLGLIGHRLITEFNYRYHNESEAHVFVGVQVLDRDETRVILEDLRGKGYEAHDLTDNEMAKSHVRHMVGGHAPLRESGRMSERIYRFEFPEHPGALMRFLDNISADWNISLFHYRNHGADCGRVLMGLQIPLGESDNFRKFLRELGFAYWDESANPAYRLFLG